MGDRVYGKADPSGVPIALHARCVEFKHPLTGAKLKIEAPFPSYWREKWLDPGWKLP